MLSDFRLPGGTARSMAEEIRAQAAAGYRTGLVQVFGPLVNGTRHFNPEIRHCVEQGLAHLVPHTVTAHAKIAIFRHPAVFQGVSHALPRISTDKSILVVNQAVRNSDGTTNYDPDQVAAVARRITGVEATWAPIGPLARRSLAQTTTGLDVRPADWLNIIDVEEWKADRCEYVDRRPVIGRHSRQQRSKWPDHIEDILAAYPISNEFRVRILGGASAVEEVLGAIPGNWEVDEFGNEDPREFLGSIDFFVYFHHPALVEAYSRAIMEALASGAVAVLPEHFRPVFGDAAVYGDPADVQSIVRRLYDDRVAYEKQSARGQEFIRERHGHQVHVHRLTDLIGEPRQIRSGLVGTRTPRRPARSRVLFVSSNGAGMGHLTRLLAMARRATDVRPVFFSMSQAVPMVESDGFHFEYCPSKTHLGIVTAEWNRFFAKRFLNVMARYTPRAVVFDGTWPYQGILDARGAFPGVAFVWSRRAMWKPGVPPSGLARGKYFDLIIEPGEVAESRDTGATRGASDATRIRPVTLLDESELLGREAAMRELGLDPARSAVVVSLGAGNINDIRSDLGIAVAALRNCSDRQVCVAQSPIADGRPDGDMDIHRISVHPLSRYLRAFDYAVMAAGYNSFHESIAFAVPTIFVPNASTATDDQVARACFALTSGIGLCVPDVNAVSMAAAVGEMEDTGQREAMAARCRQLYPGNGAVDGMAAVEQLVRGRQAAVVWTGDSR